MRKDVTTKYFSEKNKILFLKNKNTFQEKNILKTT
jgi:hypothetical protein